MVWRVSIGSSKHTRMNEPSRCDKQRSPKSFAPYKILSPFLHSRGLRTYLGNAKQIGRRKDRPALSCFKFCTGPVVCTSAAAILCHQNRVALARSTRGGGSATNNRSFGLGSVRKEPSRLRPFGYRHGLGGKAVFFRKCNHASFLSNENIKNHTVLKTTKLEWVKRLIRPS